jgi:biotin carboxyl carrier protein
VIDRKETGAEPMTDTEMPDTTAWTPDGVIRIIAEAERAGVTQLKLEIASAGIALEFARGGTIAPSTSIHAAGDSPVPDDQFIAVKAPMLGTFYRRPNPEAEPFVAIGQNVAAGDQIGLIEVMKSYHEVNAPEAGIIVDILADDGNYVEFGQTLVTIRPD